MDGAVHLGAAFVDPSRFTAPPAQYQSNTLGGLFAALASGQANAGEATARRATANEANQRANAIAQETLAKQNLGQMFAERGKVDPNLVASELHAEGITGEPTPDQMLAATRVVAARNFNPANTGDMLGEAVNAGAAGTGENMGALFRVQGVANRDADTVSGLGQPLTAGQSVFQSDADTMHASDEADLTARNDADNSTRITAANIAAAASRYGSDQQLAGEHERSGASDRASQVELERSRAARLDGQSIRSAVNGALGLRNGDTTLNIGAGVMNRVIAKTSELLQQNPAMDATTAAAAAVDQIVVDTPIGSKQPNAVFANSNHRTLRLSPAGEAYHPGASAPLPRPASPVEAARLAPGTHYMTPDGREMVR